MAGIYVHIPFCIRKCRYCDFVSFESIQKLEGYFDLLLAEADLRAGECRALEFQTVFLGGGTPSLLSGDQAARLIVGLREQYRVAKDAEITIECNPGTLDAEKLQRYRKGGINRLSIGLQSTHEELLTAIGRIHTFEDFLRTHQQARSAGFENINIDLMFGLPGQTWEQYQNTLKTVISLGPEHVSAYSLTLEEHTPLHRLVERGELRLPDEDETFEMYENGACLLEQAGYARYEISNFALPGKECRHNINYWENGQYLGLGVAAHSSLRNGDSLVRSSNAVTLEAYSEALLKCELPIASGERIGAQQEMFECVMLGLRMIKGINRGAFLKRFGITVESAYPDAIDILVRKGWLHADKDALRLTPAGLNMQNAALLEFMQ
ncbi:MAG: radical SAM family heme chaperone HemW [Bacillota bacterium]